jgi:small subunit ribosomal protein S4
MVTHGHFSVNNRRTDVPSMLLIAGDEVSVRMESRKRTFFKGLPDEAETRTPPTWLDRDLKNLAGTVLRQPDRSEIDGNLHEQSIVEYYSR